MDRQLKHVVDLLGFVASTFTLAFVLVALALMVQAPATPELGVFIDFLFPPAFAEATEPLVPTTMPPSVAQSPIHWQPFSNQAFAQARAEGKLVLLDLEAVWCHWCHVMDEQTYSRPEVQQALARHYVALKVDQDARPDLANRYQDYGWPALIIFKPDGTELVKRAGYIDAASFTRLLERVASDPVPEAPQDASVQPASANLAGSADSRLSDAVRQALLLEHDRTYDAVQGAWGLGYHKFMDADTIRFSLHQLDDSNPAIAEPARHRIEQTLTAQLQLHDPVWGGVYQYSHGGDWQHPHFEKIMKVQADNIAVYAQAGQRLNRADWIAAAERVAGYLTTFLRDPTTGGFYVSQDADVIAGHHSDAYFALDDASRQAQGLPRVDRHQYARENGWAIEALVTLYGATGKQQYLQTALQATRFVEANRALGADQVGGFSHDAYAGQTPDTLYLGDTVYLGDTLAMGQAYLALYRATGQRVWLQKAEAAARFIDQQFRVPVPPVGSVVSSPVSSSSSSSSVHPTSLSVGYLTAASKGDGLSVIKPVPLRDENVRMARFANLLFYHSGRLDYSKMAQTAMRLIVIPKRANEPFVATTLLADAELAHPPLHMTVVGAKSDPAAAALFAEALRYDGLYSRVDWYDKAEGPLPNADVVYPDLTKPAAFVCSANRCGTPIYQPRRLAPSVSRILKRPQPVEIP